MVHTSLNHGIFGRCLLVAILTVTMAGMRNAITRPALPAIRYRNTTLLPLPARDRDPNHRHRNGGWISDGGAGG